MNEAYTIFEREKRDGKFNFFLSREAEKYRYSRRMSYKIFTWIYAMEQCDLENVNNNLNPYIYSYLETSGDQSFNIYLDVVHFFNASVY